VIETLRTLIVAIRNDDVGLSAAVKVCSIALTATPDSSGLSNAQRVVPVATDLFQKGAVAEILCVADTLLYGCAGGRQPACVSVSQ
jgi:hypothetical protein